MYYHAAPMVNYQWALALAAAWLQHHHNEPQGPQMAHITAQSGVLSTPASNAANDLAARALILMWLWHLSRAKSRAILIKNQSEPPKTIPNSQWSEITPNPAPLARFGTDCHGWSQCQIERFPTRQQNPIGQYRWR